MFCPNCGAENDDDATTCQRCGFDIEHYDPMSKVNFDLSPSVDESEYSRTKMDIIKENKKFIGGVILIFIFFVAAYAGMSYLTQTPYKTIDIVGISMEVPDNSKVNVNVNSSNYATYIDKKYCFEVYVFDESNVSMSNFKEATEFEAAKKLACQYVTSIEKDNVYLNKSSDEVYSYMFENNGRTVLISSGSADYVAHAVKTLNVSNASASVTPSLTNTTVTDNNTVDVNTSTNPSDNSNVATGVKIKNITFTTPKDINALTSVKMYVGTEYAGQNVKVSAVFFNKNSTLCAEKVLTKQVSSDGYVNFESITAFAKYPDCAIIKVYSQDGSVSDTKNLGLVPCPRTQSF